MADKEQIGRYGRIAAGTGGVAAAVGAAGLALNGHFDAAVDATQASIGLLGLSGIFSAFSRKREDEKPEAVLVPVPVAIQVTPGRG